MSLSLPVLSRPRLTAVGLLALLGATVAAGQSYDTIAPRDRFAFIAPGAPTTNDPRRVPLSPAVAQARGPEGVLVLTGGRVFDAVNGRVEPKTIVLERDHIRAILAPGSSDWPAGAKVIDVAGKTILPGLIDMHVHVTYPDAFTPADEQGSEGAGVLRGLRNLRYFLESGVTTVRDLGGVLNAPYLLAEWMEQDRAPGPRLFVAGHIITGTGGHAAERPITAIHSPAFTREVDGPVEWRKAIRETFKQGASVIKLASYFAPDEVHAAVLEAHALGLKVTVHAETAYIKWAVEAGVDMIEHPLPRSDETIRLMAEHHVESIPTLQVYEGSIDTSGGYYDKASSGRFTITRQADFDIFKKLKAAGIKMGVGTDTIGAANESTPNQYIAELKWFVKGGYSIPEALMAATRTNSELLDMADRLGTLESGKLADVIVVNGKPDLDLDDLHKIDMVIRDGFVMVDHGQISIPRHQPRALIRPSPPDDVH